MRFSEYDQDELRGKWEALREKETAKNRPERKKRTILKKQRTVKWPQALFLFQRFGKLTCGDVSNKLGADFDEVYDLLSYYVRRRILMSENVRGVRVYRLSKYL